MGCCFCCSSVFKTETIIESLDFAEINKLKLRKSIMDVNICLKYCESFQTDKYLELLGLFDEFVRTVFVSFKM
jgi:hypothetical protein